MPRFHLTKQSENRKTGPIAVSTSDDKTCPPSCGAFKVCYAKGNRTAIFWRQLSSGKAGVAWSEFVASVKRLAPGQLFRHNQAGDLPGIGNRIDAGKLKELATAAKHLRAWTYSHKPLTRKNVAALHEANSSGITVNVSCDNLADVDAAVDTGLPVVVLLPSDTCVRMQTTAAGNRVVTCPVYYRDGVTCSTCGNGRPLCERGAKRNYVVGLPAIGIRQRQADDIAKGIES